MTIFQALILGIVQGLTEFLPVSSSAHLVLVPFLLGWKIPIEQAFPFDVLVQLGTLVAVVIYFWGDLLEIIKAFIQGIKNRQPFEDHQSRIGWYVILATIPAGIAGLLLKPGVEAAFNNPKATGIFLFVTSAILFLAELFGKRTRSLPFMNAWDALFIGIAQALSIFPGVSRSGSTIGSGLLRNFHRTAAARFSFFMSIPIMLAAGLLGIIDMLKIPHLTTFLPSLVIGFVSAAVVGYFAIHWFLRYLNRRSLNIFAYYCVLLGTITLLISYAK